MRGWRRVLSLLILWGTVSSSSALTNAKIGVVYWPAFGTPTGYPYAQAALGPADYYQYAPWYCVQTTPIETQCTQTQADMDLEIQLAAASGFTHFGFVWYDSRAATGGPGSGAAFAALQTSYGLYQSSARTDTQWAAIIIPGYLGATDFGSSDVNWHANVEAIVDLFAQARYEKVLTTRPLLYIYYVAANIATYFNGSTANMGVAIDYLRVRSIARGYGDPYVVFMAHATGATGHTLVDAANADALGAYNYRRFAASVAAPKTYADLDSQVQTFWTTMESGGDPTVPILQFASTSVARLHRVPPAEAGGLFQNFGVNLNWGVGTPAAMAAGQATAIGAYIDANPTVVVCQCFLVYSWSECDEGYPCLMPHVEAPPLSNPPYTPGASSGLTTILNALAPVLYPYTQP